MLTRAAGEPVYLNFETLYNSVGTVWTGSPAAVVYKDNSATPSSAGVTVTISVNGVVGQNRINIDTTADGTFYANGSHFVAKASAGTVGGESIVGRTADEFDLSAAPSSLSQADVRTAVGLASANLDTQLATLAGYIDTEVAAIAAAIAALNNLSAAQVATALTTFATTAITESYAAEGAAPTRDQALMMLLQILSTFEITDNLDGSSTLTVKKLDGTTAAMTMTLNGDATTPPTSSTRAT